MSKYDNMLTQRRIKTYILCLDDIYSVQTLNVYLYEVVASYFLIHNMEKRSYLIIVILMSLITVVCRRFTQLAIIVSCRIGVT